jgi:hypothetical protein
LAGSRRWYARNSRREGEDRGGANAAGGAQRMQIPQFSRGLGNTAYDRPAVVVGSGPIDAMGAVAGCLRSALRNYQCFKGGYFSRGRPPPAGPRNQAQRLPANGWIASCDLIGLHSTSRKCFGELRIKRGDIMKTTQVFIFLGWLLVSGVVSTSDVMAADLQYDSRVRVVTGCGWRHTCCPDRYSCSSLYGAYGPWGGAPYWTRYTFGGWGYIR